MSLQLDPEMIAILGAATAAAGAGLIIWGASAASSRASSGAAESLLAPTLAVDTLDPDLRVAYMRTLVLDARLLSQNEGPPPPLGRELRRALVAAQAHRLAGSISDEIEELQELIDQVCDAAERGDAPDPSWAPSLDRARTIRRTIAPAQAIAGPESA